MLCLSGFELYSRWVPLSFINPIIYTVRLREFRVAFINKITCGTATLVEAEENDCETSGLPAPGLEFKKGIEITQKIHKLIQCRKLPLIRHRIALTGFI